MLNQETKKKIDSARDILVGKVPDPKAQVEQITTALIYKFMDDMDKQSASLPKGKAQFFTNGFEKYAWSKMMDAKLGGQERLNLYVEAITKMSKNPHLPQLFRDVFKDAFLPYRDPETLNLFLKEINSFSYDHSENLGDAFEYLLSVLGSQGEAGQFRTPRHIIDFMVEVVDPKKDDTILDPACGTAGFLISAYKHILKVNKNKPLTPDEKKRLMNNLVGYDISPDMVKLSLVNMYLHGFPSPNIHEYDTLTSDEKWDEHFDVMMANPPFMTPKGGIRPHRRFMVQANRSEVLFVDYILEHLNNKGRAGIIVPEGIIFQSAGAYKQLRKLLVEDGLYAVVSMPGGVFNPYSGVRTSILFFDNQLAKQSKDILFVKVLNDGFGLGAQRRPIDRNDLPHAVEVLQAQQEAIKTGKKNKLLKEGSLFAWAVSKTKIAEDGDYNLSGDRYTEGRTIKTKYNLVELESLIDIINGLWKGKKPPFEKVKVIRNTNFTKDGRLNLEDVAELEVETKQFAARRLQAGDIIVEKSGGSDIQPVGRVALFALGEGRYSFSNFTSTLRVKDISILEPLYLWRCLHYLWQAGFTEKLQKQTSGIRNLDFTAYKKLRIPLPPFEVQKEIVDELDSYQKVIDGAKQIIAHHKPRLKVDPDWKEVNLGDVCSFQGGSQPPKSEFIYEPREGYVKFVQIRDFGENGVDTYILKSSKNKLCNVDDVLIARYGASLGRICTGLSGAYNVALLKVTPDTKKLSKQFLYYFLKTDYVQDKIAQLGGRAAQAGVRPDDLRILKVPLPPMDVQEKIVSQLQEEERHIESAKRMIEIYEEKIKSKIAEVWGE